MPRPWRCSARTSGEVIAALYVGPPGGGPQLDVVARTDHHGLPFEPRPLPQAGRHHHPTLAIEIDLEGPREDETREGASASVRDRLGRHAVGQFLEVTPREHPQAAIDPAGDVGPAVEPGTEARRDGDAPLRVDRVAVLAGEHLLPRTSLPGRGVSSLGPTARPTGGTRRCSARQPIHPLSPLCATLGHVGGIIHRTPPSSTGFRATGMGKRYGAGWPFVRPAASQRHTGGPPAAAGLVPARA